MNAYHILTQNTLLYGFIFACEECALLAAYIGSHDIRNRLRSYLIRGVVPSGLMLYDLNHGNYFT